MAGRYLAGREMNAKRILVAAVAAMCWQVPFFMVTDYDMLDWQAWIMMVGVIAGWAVRDIANAHMKA